MIKRKTLGERYGMRCWWCSQQLRYDMGWQNSVTREHVVPVSLGGPNEYWNLVAACYRCNTMRGTTPQAEWERVARTLRPDHRLADEARRAYLKQKRRARARAISAPVQLQPTPWQRLQEFVYRSGAALVERNQSLVALFG